MKLVFYNECINGNEIFFWTIIASLVIMMILSIIFVRKETKNGSK